MADGFEAWPIVRAAVDAGRVSKIENQLNAADIVIRRKPEPQFYGRHQGPASVKKVIKYGAAFFPGFHPH